MDTMDGESAPCAVEGNEQEQQGFSLSSLAVQGDDIRIACASSDTPFKMLYQKPEFYLSSSSSRAADNSATSERRPPVLRPTPLVERLQDSSQLRLCGEGRSSSVFQWLPEAGNIAAKSSSHPSHPSWCIKKVTLQDQPPPHDVFKEIQMLASIRHENIAELIAASEEETDPFTTIVSLLMPYYPIGLIDLLQDVNTIPQDLHATAGLQVDTTTTNSIQAYLQVVLNIASQLFKALAYLHDEAHIAHRDIKPLNLRLLPVSHPESQAPSSYILKLLDFGTATSTRQPKPPATTSLSPFLGAEKRSNTTAVCSGVFRAPELLFSSIHGYDPRGIDIWAGACVISMFFTAFTDAQKEKGGWSDDEEVFGPRSDDGSEDSEALELDAADQNGIASGRTQPAFVGDAEEPDTSAQQKAHAVIPPPSLRRRNLFDLEIASDIPLAADIFQLKGLPIDAAEWPEAATFRPPLDRMPFARYPPSDIYTRLPLASELRQTRDASPESDCVMRIVELIDACTALSAGRRPTAAQVVYRLSRATRTLGGEKE